MAIKKLFLFLIVFLVVFTVLFSVFGRSGWLVNRSLEASLEILVRQEEEKRLEVEALRQRRQALESQSYADDVALSLGYNRQGDVVYYFQEPDVIEVTPSAEKEERQITVYEGTDTWILVLSALGAALVVSLLVTIVSNRSHHPSQLKEKQRDEYENLSW